MTEQRLAGRQHTPETLCKKLIKTGSPPLSALKELSARLRGATAKTPCLHHRGAATELWVWPAGLKRLLSWQDRISAPLFEAVEGVPCRAALLDGPAALVAHLMHHGPTSDAGLAVIQAGAAACLLAVTHMVAPAGGSARSCVARVDCLAVSGLQPSCQPAAQLRDL